LPTVSFVKPYGAENEHPGYASEPDGSDHLVSLLKTIMSGPQADDTLVVVTYDEFGGQWDHVSPPGLGTKGVSDEFGPGTRIPALVLSKSFRRSGVDHTVYDTTSILATIEHGLHLAPVASRDAAVADLSAAVRIGHQR
jgi:phospholipase C